MRIHRRLGWFGRLRETTATWKENKEGQLFASGSTGGGDSTSEPCTLSGMEFVRRWTLHILPRHYPKTRQFGGDSFSPKGRYILAGGFSHRTHGRVSHSPEGRHIRQTQPSSIINLINKGSHQLMAAHQQLLECIIFSTKRNGVLGCATMSFAMVFGAVWLCRVAVPPAGLAFKRALTGG